MLLQSLSANLYGDGRFQNSPVPNFRNAGFVL